jgi:excisionase family DNA binding protein
MIYAYIRLYQAITLMEELLTAREVQEILKVDRITVYRMLNDGRLKGSKIGQQWRFLRRDVDRLLGNEAPPEEPLPPEVDPSFPTHCVQTIQDLFSDVSQNSALIVNMEGEPLTQVTHPCSFCQLMLQNPTGQEACRATWRTIAEQASTGSKFFTCHAGIQYVAAPIVDEGKPMGFFLTGQFHWQIPDAREDSERLRRLASSHDMPLEQLQQTAAAVPVIDPREHTRVEAWPFTAARAVQSILHERIGFMGRLQQIANLTKI